MGQYHYIANLDKREYLHPRKFNDGLKLLEFGSSGQGTLLGLTFLLAKDDGLGGGDFHAKRLAGQHVAKRLAGQHEMPSPYGHAEPRRLLAAALVGSWAGDRVAIMGDYGPEAEGGDSPWAEDHPDAEWTDISERVVDALCAVDHFFAQHYRAAMEAKADWSLDARIWLKASER